MGMVPKSTKSETRILNAISFSKVVGFVAVLMLSIMIAPIIFDSKVMSVLFCIFADVVYILCVVRSPTDPNKMFIIGLKEWLKFKTLAHDIYGESSQEYISYKEMTKKNEELKKNKKSKKIKA